MTSLVIVAAGWATSIQDAGRRGYTDIGVSTSGALDEPTRALLNRLVGNPPDAAVIETLGGLRIRADASAIIATSADLAPTVLRGGDELEVNPAAGDLWGYLAVRGGIDVAPVLGSRSHDSRSGVGPPLPTTGASIAIGADPATPIVVDHAPRPVRPDAIDIWPGPRVDWFVPDALERFALTDWIVSGDVSRVGARLDGSRLERLLDAELPSEGLVLGAIQVPPDGRPVVMLADHPTTGGYPVLAVVAPDAVGVVAQARPGSRLRFRNVLR